MRKTLLWVLTSVFAHLHLSAQWVTYDKTNSPIPTDANVPHVAVSAATGDVYALTFDTSYHLFKKNGDGNWIVYTQFDSILGSINAVYDTKYAYQTLWMQTSKGIVLLKNDILDIVPYEPGVTSGTNGLVPMSENEVWFIGGKGGKGITRLNIKNGWYYVDAITHPNFKQDIGLTDLKYSSTTHTLWIGANCFGADAGVYSYDIANNKLTQFKPDNKYNCVHAVEPTSTHLFVGTANFSSIRIMSTNGVYQQTLNAPIISWVTETRLDPADSAKIWILTDRGLMHFKDTLDYQSYNAANTPLKGYMNELSVWAMGNQSYQLWVGSTKGLFSYTYQSSPETGIHETEAMTFFEIAPNPTNKLINITSKVNMPVQISVIDAQGRTVIESGVNNLADHPTLDVSSIPNGIYFIVLRSAYGAAKRKLVRIN